MDLLKKRGEILTDHAAMEKHNPAWKGTGLQDRPVAFLCDDEVVVIGECVGKIFAGLTTFMATADKDRAKNNPQFSQALGKISKLLESPAPAELRVSQQTWNAYLLGLNEAGVTVVLTDGSNV